MKRLREGLREDILLVIDGAYAEYMSEKDYSAGKELVDDPKKDLKLGQIRNSNSPYLLAALTVYPLVWP